MKRITYILTLFVITSCADFLNTIPQDIVSPDNFLNNKEEAFQLLTGVYRELKTNAMYGGMFDAQVDAATDLSFWDRSQQTPSLMTNDYSPGLRELNQIWESLYRGINNANFFLENIEKLQKKSKDEDLVIINSYIGEAKFLRAFFYFHLACLWGDVPLQTISQKNAIDVHIPKTSQEKVLDFVSKEMEESYLLVLDDAEVIPGQISKPIVCGMLARVYLKIAGWPINKKEKFNEVLKWAKLVNEKNDHQLNPDYKQIFINLAQDIVDTKYKESIWEIFFEGNGRTGRNTWGQVGSLVGIQNQVDYSDTSEGYSYGFYRITLKLWDLYGDLNGDGITDFVPNDPNEKNNPDVRRDWNCAPYQFNKDRYGEVYKTYWGYKDDFSWDSYNHRYHTYKLSQTQIVERNAGKYRREYENIVPRDKQTCATNFPVLRYADVLLMIAEASNEINNGPTAESYEAINAVRERANVPPVSNMDYLTFKHLIMDERARELCFEGNRRFDLIRWNKYLDEMYKSVLSLQDSRWSQARKFGVRAAQNASERYLWYPIPSRDLSLNNKLTQNPIWE